MWIECNIERYREAINSGNNQVRAEKHETIWHSPMGAPVAKSSRGYLRMPTDGEELFFVWRPQQ